MVTSAGIGAWYRMKSSFAGGLYGSTFTTDGLVRVMEIFDLADGRRVVA